MEEKRCKDCIYLVSAKGEGQTLVCTNRENSKGILYSAKDCDSSCRNYQAVSKISRPEVVQPEEPDIRFIPLTQGRYAIVDSDDYEWLNRYKWHAITKLYGTYTGSYLGGKHIYMHRLIMEPPAGMVVDHKDGNGLNNTRRNLRNCTQSQNMWNSKGCSKTSKFKGVCWNKRKKKWSADIQYQSTRIHIGYFAIEIEAAKAYDKNAEALFGEFAHLNFPKVVYNTTICEEKEIN